jgi:uncharacterized membrane protein
MREAGYIYVLGTLILTVFGQLVIKWRVEKLGALPDGILAKGKALFLFSLDPFVLSGYLSALLASFFWIAALTKLELSRAYPMMSLAPGLVFLLSLIFLGESYSIGKALGFIFILAGVYLSANY